MKKLFLILLISVSICILSINSLNEKKKDKPMSMTVSYVTPLRDLDEQRKYMEEHLNYVRNFKRTEDKLKDDIETLKMMLNQQNTQIEKLNSIVHANYASARQLKFKKDNPS